MWRASFSRFRSDSVGPEVCSFDLTESETIQINQLPDISDSSTRAWLIKQLGRFEGDSIVTDVGTLAGRAAKEFTTQYSRQIEAWQQELNALCVLARELISSAPEAQDWPVLLEYPIPRRQKRPDAILIARNVIFVIEFKFGSTEFDAPARWQVENYSLDLRDFHAESAGRPLVPVLVATQARAEQSMIQLAEKNPVSVWRVQLVAPAKLAQFILLAYKLAHRPQKDPINALTWDRSYYKPSNNIIEAAQRLFSHHAVRDINHAHAANLEQTTASLIAAVRRAKQENIRSICFVTGVPGAGKTLTGLNAVHSPELRNQSSGASVFLSGNGPLIKIIRAALVKNLKAQNIGTAQDELLREIESFIRNVHGFINHYVRDNALERPENVVVFDEAQRAWSGAKMMKEDRGARSEPQLMLEIMGRQDWCTLVALVGGGQEIHDGEAGLEEWGRALSDSKHRWHVFASPEALRGGVGVAGHRLFDREAPSNCHVIENDSLHLQVSQRSYRAQVIADWVNRVLQGDAEGAKELLSQAGEFPLVLTRDLATARKWLRLRSGRDKVNGKVNYERRCGLVASSENARLRAYGLEVSNGFRKGYPYAKWFLADDVFSSCQLEVVATEFECQGLELDWTGVCWGDDLPFDPSRNGWLHHRFYRGSWIDVTNAAKRQYLLNKYRVLLTRAREGMVIWIPPGDVDDGTRPKETMDATAEFFIRAGVPLF